MSVKNIVNHAKFAFVVDPAKYVGLDKPYTKNKYEKAGSALLLPARKLPAATVQMVKDGYRWTIEKTHDPVIITVGLTAIAMTSVQFAFYPDATTRAANYLYDNAKIVANEAWRHLEPIVTNLPYRLAIYSFIQTSILGTSLRAIGRFTNEELRPALDAMCAPKPVGMTKK